MTILCVTTDGIPGIRPCTHRDEHRITCLDHPGRTVPAGVCGGCFPRKADRGFLCARCFDAVEHAVAEWPRFEALVEAADGRPVSPNADEVQGSKAVGYSNLTLTALALDECRRHLASLAEHRGVEQWVSTREGARDAVQFARAATAAYRSLEVEERPTLVNRVRCNNCGRLTLVWHPGSYTGGDVRVECSNCGHTLDQDRLERFRDGDRYTIQSEACADGNHTACEAVGCRCPHHLEHDHAHAAA